MSKYASIVKRMIKSSPVDKFKRNNRVTSPKVDVKSYKYNKISNTSNAYAKYHIDRGTATVKNKPKSKPLIKKEIMIDRIKNPNNWIEYETDTHKKKRKMNL